MGGLLQQDLEIILVFEKLLQLLLALIYGLLLLAKFSHDLLVLAVKLLVLLVVVLDLLFKLGSHLFCLSLELVSRQVEAIVGLLVSLIRVLQLLVELLYLLLGCFQLLSDNLACFVVLFSHVCHFGGSNVQLLLQLFVFCHSFLKFLPAFLEVLGQLQQLFLLF